MIKISNIDVQKRIRKKKKRFKIIFLIILISVGSIFLFKNPVLKVKNIIIDGNSIVNEQKLIELSGINIGDNLLKLNMKYINENIMTNPYVETLKIKRTVFGNVYITISERQGAGIVEFEDKYATIDKKCVVIEILDRKEGVNLPLIKGLDIKSADPGKSMELRDIRKLDAINIIFDNITNNDLSGIINEVDIKNLLSIVLKTKYNINIKIGTIENIENKFKISRSIMEDDVRKKGLKGTIDVSFNGNPVFRQE